MKLGAVMMIVIPMSLAAGHATARADEALPPVADVVAHARAVMDRKPQQIVCNVTVDTQLLDKTGKPQHDEHRQGKATLRGDDQDIESQSVVRDGHAMTSDEIADERAKVQQQKAKSKKKGSSDDDFDISPMTAKKTTDEAFELVRKETLWGRPAYVLTVRAQKSSPEKFNGTLWIDAEKYVELKAELTPAEMPPHADWIKMQVQYVPGPNDVAVPAYLHIEGAGHMLFMHKQFRTTLRWSDCR